MKKATIDVRIRVGIYSKMEKINDEEWEMNRSLVKSVIIIMVLLISCFAFGESYWVYTAHWKGNNIPPQTELKSFTKENGSLEYIEFGEDGIFRRHIFQFGKPGVGYPGFTSLTRSLLEEKISQAKHKSEGNLDMYRLDASPLSVEWVLSTYKDGTGLMKAEVYFADELVYIENRRELYTANGVRPEEIIIEYENGGSKGIICQVFESAQGSKSSIKDEFLVSGGKCDIVKVDVKGDPGKAMQYQPVQFTAPRKGLNLSFDSGWWPNGKDGGFEENPGGFPVQVRIKAAAVANYQADVQGFFYFDEPWLTAGNASGFWGYDFGGELFMKAGFDIGIIPPFVVDIPYIPDINLRSTKYDNFNSWLLDSVSVLQDETPKTHLFDVDLVPIILSLVGVTLPDWLKWVPFSAGAGLDVSTKTDGTLECDTISLQEGLVIWTEGQSVPVEVGNNGYRTILNYNEICNLYLTLKFFPTVFIKIFSLRYDLPILTIPWSPFNGALDLEFTSCEVNFTSEPPSQPATDWFTEDFSTGNDLDYHRIEFTPVSNIPNKYIACTVSGVNSFNVDPSGGNVVSLDDDSYVEVLLSPGHQVYLYEVAYDKVYIGSNGYLTFTQGDTQKNESLEAHFSMPRVSGMFDDLKPNKGGIISWKELEDRFVVTFENVRTDGIISNDVVNFQIEMYFNGKIAITWLRIDPLDGLAGLSEGKGVPQNFRESDLTKYAGCIEPEGIPEGTEEGSFEGEGAGEGGVEGIEEGEGEIPEYCPKKCAITACGDTPISGNSVSAWITFCSMGGMDPLVTDTDSNGMVELANLYLLDVVLQSPGLDNRCCILTAWQNNYAVLVSVVDNANQQGLIPISVINGLGISNLKYLFAGLATIAEDTLLPYISQFASQMGVSIPLGQLDRSAVQYLGAYGDADTDRVCNLAEYNDTYTGTLESLTTFVISALDPSARSNGGGCGAPCFLEGNEGEILPEYSVTVNIDGNSGPVSIELIPPSSEGLPPGRYYLGTNVTAQVSYDSSKDVWQGWLMNGVFLSMSNPVSFSVTSDIVLTAMFVPVTPEGVVEGELPPIIPVIQPFVLNLGEVQNGECVEGKFTVRNSQLSVSVFGGVATILAPELPEGVFQIVSGASYQLAPGEQQDLVVRFCANGLQAGEYTGLVIFPGAEELVIHPVVCKVAGSPVEGEGEVLEGSVEGLIEGVSEGSVEGTQEGEGEELPSYHSADTNMDWKVDLRELLRLIQIFNSWGYHCADDPSLTEDGYMIGVGANHSCKPHSSDYNPQDWRIDLRELLRAIQFFNAGGYHLDPLGEDGYGVGIQ